MTATATQIRKRPALISDDTEKGKSTIRKKRGGYDSKIKLVSFQGDNKPMLGGL